MKKVVICILLGFSLVLGTGGCVNWGSNSGSSSAKDYVKPAVSLTVLTVLDNAVDAEDRMKRALVIFHSGSIIEALASGNVPDADTVKSAMIEYLPEGAIWSDFIASLDDIYKTAYSRANDDTQLALDILVEIAAGCREGASKYIQSHAEEVPDIVTP